MVPVADRNFAASPLDKGRSGAPRCAACGTLAGTEEDFCIRRDVWRPPGVEVGVNDVGDDDVDPCGSSAEPVVGWKSRGVSELDGAMDDGRVACSSVRGVSECVGRVVGEKSGTDGELDREGTADPRGRDLAPPCFVDGTKSGGVGTGLPLLPLLST